jgi:hypothetical protein
MQRFSGPHLVHRQIDANRTATAWLGTHATWGGEFTSMTKETGVSQFHPATMHWVMPSGEIGWIEVTRSPKIDAEADRTGLSLKTSGNVTLRVYAGKQSDGLDTTVWKLPGLTLAVQTDAQGYSAAPASDCEACHDITYKDVHTLRLEVAR